jgi:predicted polyphosphate/ATP-dependent NAD kinase|tara:strand:+ start:218 stop:1324 length:1107 start_codon:yes stop_codon:yes gene_type:complete
MKIGLVLNPLAGIGGPVALKGSDGVSKTAIALGGKSHVEQRVRECLECLIPWPGGVTLMTYAGVMGENVCQILELPFEVLGGGSEITSAVDTQQAVTKFIERDVDLILFAGGDGTARDICDVVMGNTVVLGIPSGVKMHSGVFANNPRAAGKLVHRIICGELVAAMDAEVRDVDEDALREGVVKPKFYGELCVPADLQYVQHTKAGGLEVEGLVLQEIAAEVIENMDANTTYVVGAGTTTDAIMQALGLENTLLGVDVIRDRQILTSDATELALYDLVCRHQPVRIVISVIGGQGHIFGRGNQQVSSRVLRAVGTDNIIVVATKTKLEALAGRPLIVDTGEMTLDDQLCGLQRVITGYQDSVLMQVCT